MENPLRDALKELVDASGKLKSFRTAGASLAAELNITPIDADDQQPVLADGISAGAGWDAQAFIVAEEKLIGKHHFRVAAWWLDKPMPGNRPFSRADFRKELATHANSTGGAHLDCWLHIIRDHTGVVHVVHCHQQKGRQRPTLRHLELLPGDFPWNTAHTVLSCCSFEKAKAAVYANDVRVAFALETLNNRFFDASATVLQALRDEIAKLKKRGQWKEDPDYTATRLFNQLIFLKFIERKGWLNQDRNYLRGLYETLRSLDKGTQLAEAFEQLLRALADSRASWDEKAFGKLPLINGQLLREREEVPPLPNSVFDYFFEAVNASYVKRDDPHYGILEKFNFTIAENTPLDQDVAINPDLIGQVFERIVLELEKTEGGRIARHVGGAYYTPADVVEFMTQQSLYYLLLRRCKDGGLTEGEAYKLLSEDSDTAAVHGLSKEKLRCIQRALKELKAFDPAVGSGAFLIGLAQELVRLRQRVWLGLHESFDSHEAHFEVIRDNLAGADINPLAVEVCRMRLSLMLAVDDQSPYAKLIERKRPVLPNMEFIVRSGDTLLEGLFDTPADLYRTFGEDLKKLARESLKLRRKYFNAKEPLQREQVQLELLENERELIQPIVAIRITELKHSLGQSSIGGLETKATKKKLEELSERKREIVQLERILNKLKNVNLLEYETKYHALHEQVYRLSFPVHFPEVFVDGGGFDFIIANPPYVRQAEIGKLVCGENGLGGYTAADYKNDVILTAETDAQELGWPTAQFSGHSDLYVYFMVRAHRLLRRDGGVFCFVTSNSWLDVSYGKQLQEFLLRVARVHCIADVKLQRSFTADVNTVVTITEREENKAAREASAALFVMFDDYMKFLPPHTVGGLLSPKTRSDSVIPPNLRFKQETQEVRAVALSQAELFRRGCHEEHDDDEEQAPPKGFTGQPSLALPGQQIRLGESATGGTGFSAKPLVFQGDKWGGKYLRAPDIYWTILEKGKDKLVRLGDIAEVRRGFTTGANDFFYLKPLDITVAEVKALADKKPDAPVRVANGAGWEGEIEARYLRPVIKSPRECKRIVININDLSFVVFMCHENRRTLSGTLALDYIKWGEKQEYQERPTCRGHNPWWNLGSQERFDWLILRFRDKRNWVPINEIPFLLAGDIVFIGTVNKRSAITIANALAASTLSVLVSEIQGRINLGDGLLTTYGPEILPFEFMDPDAVPGASATKLKSAFDTLKGREVKSIFDEVNMTDRRAVDDIIFDILGLTAAEREAVYTAVVELVSNRLDKARSM